MAPEAWQGLWRRLRNPTFCVGCRATLQVLGAHAQTSSQRCPALSLLTVLSLPCCLGCPSPPTSTTMGWCTSPVSVMCCWTTPSHRRASAWGAWSPSAPSRTLSGVWAAWGSALWPPPHLGPDRAGQSLCQAWSHV